MKLERFSDGMTRHDRCVGAGDRGRKIDTTGVQCAVDVGGANGTLLQLLQHKNPSLSGIVFDRPNVVEHTEAEIARNDSRTAPALSAGSFFESVPAG